MDVSKVPAPPDGASRMVPVPAEFHDVLTRTASWLIGSRAGDAHEGIGDGDEPSSVVDLLVCEMTQAIDARSEIVAAAERPDRAVRLDALELVGPAAISREHQRIAGMWGEGSDDYVALAEYTTRLSGLERLVILAGASR